MAEVDIPTLKKRESPLIYSAANLVGNPSIVPSLLPAKGLFPGKSILGQNEYIELIYGFKYGFSFVSSTKMAPVFILLDLISN